METFQEAIILSLSLILSLDKDLFEIIRISIKVSMSALLISSIIAFPLGAVLALTQFKLRTLVIGIFNALMGLPPVVVGLIVYLYLSKSGPLGFLNLLYTPTAMIIAQSILIVPIITSLSCQILEDLNIQYKDLFDSFVIKKYKVVITYIVDAKYSLLSVILAGFGRAISEVGAVIIVGGNIDHLTRVMTTAIALETSKGELGLAMALGIILLFIAIIVNLFLIYVKSTGKTSGYV